MALDILDCLALHEAADPLAACERARRERDCRSLCLAIERRLQRSDSAVSGELQALLAGMSEARLDELLNQLEQGCCAGDLCDCLGIPASRRHTPGAQ